MADNVTIDNAAGDTIAARDISDVKYQRVLMDFEKGAATVDVSATDPLPVEEPFLLIQKDERTSHRILRGFGERSSVQSETNGEDVWRGNDLSPAGPDIIPTPADAGEQMTVVSESSLDTSAGTGVRTIRLEYIDAAGAEQTEDITMNGTTPVNTVATNIRFVNDMYTLTVGSNDVSQGNIKIYKTGDTSAIYNMIAQGGNQSLVPHRMVPAGKTLFLRGWNASDAEGSSAFTQTGGTAFRIRSTDKNGTRIPGVFLFKDTVFLNQSTSGELPCYEAIPALSIIKVSAWAQRNNGEASCSWWGILVDD